MTVFLLNIFDGAKNLFYLTDDNERIHFFIEKKNTYRLLVYKRFFMDATNGKTINFSNQFLLQLRAYLTGFAALEIKLENSVYTKASLIDLYKAYYKCINADPGYKRKNDKILTSCGFFAGTSIT